MVLTAKSEVLIAIMKRLEAMDAVSKAALSVPVYQEAARSMNTYSEVAGKPHKLPKQESVEHQPLVHVCSLCGESHWKRERSALNKAGSGKRKTYDPLSLANKLGVGRTTFAHKIDGQCNKP